MLKHKSGTATKPLVKTVLAAVFFAWNCSTASAVVLLNDDFDNGNPATPSPDASLVGNWGGYTGGVSESAVDSKLTVSTTNATVSNSTNFRLAANSQINPFTSTVTISVRDFALYGTGSYEDPGAGRFRIGLASDNGSFYGTSDALAFEIAANGSSFALGSKLDATSGDPGRTTASGTVSSPIAGFDFAITSTSWSLVLYDEDDVIIHNESGSWGPEGLGNAADWGDNGASSLLLAVQNSSPNGSSPYSGEKTFEIGSLTLDVTAIPEPGKAMLLGLAFVAFCVRRVR